MGFRHAGRMIPTDSDDRRLENQQLNHKEAMKRGDSNLTVDVLYDIMIYYIYHIMYIASYS